MKDRKTSGANASCKKKCFSTKGIEASQMGLLCSFALLAMGVFASHSSSNFTFDIDGDVLGVMIHEDDTVEGATFGSVPDTSDVNLFTGGYHPSVGLETLPGVGPLPDLSLRYGAGQKNGILGAGWGLAFESRITRRSADGGTSPFNYTTSDPSWFSPDVFYVDGQKLYPQNDGTYRAERDPFTVYTPIREVVPGTNKHRIVQWTALLAGTTHTYGSREATTGCAKKAVAYGAFDPNLNAPQGDDGDHDACMTPVSWHLSEVRDAFENVLSIDYGVDEGTPLPTQIRYNTGTHNPGGAHVVAFEYERRNDQEVSYAHGGKHRLTHRLAAVSVYAERGGTITHAKRYAFDYVYGNADGRSLLTEVLAVPVQVDGSASDNASTEVIAGFEYANDGLQDAYSGEWQDLDIVDESGVLGGSGAYLLSGYSSADYDPSPNDADFEDDRIQANTQTQLLDINSDGRTDIVAFNTRCERNECESNHRVFLGEATDADAAPRFVYNEDLSDDLDRLLGPTMAKQWAKDYEGEWHNAVLQPLPFALTDINGDGQLDLVRGDDESAYLPFPEETSFYKNKVVMSVGVPNSRYTVDASSWTAYDTAADAYPLGGDASVLSKYAFADINGDGRADLVGAYDFVANNGSFAVGNAQDIRLRDDASSSWYHPSDLIPFFVSSGRAGCMIRDSEPARLAHEVPVHEMDDGTLKRADRMHEVSPEDWLARHSLSMDVNGDGLVDRIIALSWPQLIGDEWYMTGNCGGVRATYLGRGDGSFERVAAGDTGGSFEWAGGPHAVSQRMQVSFMYENTYPVCGNAGDTVRYISYPTMAHVGFSDIDGNGAMELTQLCNDGDNGLVLASLPYRGDGLSEDGRRLFRAPLDGGACPDSAYIHDSDAIDPRGPWVLRTGIDLDGDMLPEQIEMGAGLDWEKIDSRQSHSLKFAKYRRNQKTVPSYRLKAVIGRHGGRTNITWSTSMLQDEDAKVNVPVVASVSGKNGTTRFTFTEPAIADDAHGRPHFVGFARAEARGTSGTKVVVAHATEIHNRGQQTLNATLDADGHMHDLSISVSSDVAGLPDADTTAPYFAPIRTHCTFVFAQGSERSFTNDHADVPLGEIYRCYAASGSTNLQSLARTTDRMTVNRMEYNADSATTSGSNGSVTRATSYGDVAVLGDETFVDTVVTHDAGLNLDRKVSEMLSDHEHQPLMHKSWGNFAGPMWRSETEYNDQEGTQRTRLATLLGNGLVQTEHSFGEHAPTTVAYDACGLMKSTEQVVNGQTLTVSQVHDARCQRTESTSAHGVHKTFSYDDHGRMIEANTVVPARLHHEATIHTTHFAHDGNSAEDEPTSVTLVHETDGTQTVDKTYVDRFGRTWRTTTCKRQDQSTSNDDSLAARYACAPDEAAVPGVHGGDYATHQLTYYNAHNGRVALQTLAFDARDGGFASMSASQTVWDVDGRSNTADHVIPNQPLGAGIPLARFAYDAFGRKVAGVDSEGLLVQYDMERVYNAELGQVVDVQTQIAADGVVARSEKSALQTDMYRGDRYGNLQWKSREQRDAIGRTVSTTDAFGQVRSMQRDGYGRVNSTTLPQVEVASCDSADAVITNIQAQSESYRYNEADEVQALTMASGAQVMHQADALGRTISSMFVSADGHAHVQAQQTRYFDDGHHRVEYEDALGNVFVEYRNAQGKAVMTLNAWNESTLTHYDARGRAIHTIYPWGEQWLASYDRLGRVSRTQALMGAPLGSISPQTKTMYDARGNVLESVDGAGTRTRHEYDAADRLTKTFVGNPGHEHLIEENVYDALGRLHQVHAQGVVTQYIYDAHSRLAAVFFGVNTETGSATAEEYRYYDDLDRFNFHTQSSPTMLP